MCPGSPGPATAAALEREVRGQLAAMRDAGVVPRHIDSHQHVHVMPTIWPIVKRVADEAGIMRVRVPATPTQATAKSSPAGRVLQWLAARRRGSSSLPCIGVAHAGHNTAARLIAELDAARGGDVELVAHPAIDTPVLQARYPAWHFDWRTEQAALLSDEWGDAILRMGYDIHAPETDG